MKIVRAIKNGWIKPKPVPEQPNFYMLWSDTNQVSILLTVRLNIHMICILLIVHRLLLT